MVELLKRLALIALPLVLNEAQKVAAKKLQPKPKG